MLQVNEATRNAWLNNEIKTIRFLLSGEEVPASQIYAESMQIEESINDFESLHYFGDVPARLEIMVRGIDPDIEGESVQVFMTAGDTEELCLFTGKVTSASIDATKQKVKIIAYDELYFINKMDVADWYTTRVFPMTIKQLRDGFFSFLEIEQETVTLCNDDRLVPETIGGEIKGATIIQAICEINGVFGCMSRDGETFLYKSLPQESLETVTPGRIKSLDYEDFTCKPINRLIIREDSEDLGSISGTGNNTYIVQGNVLAFGQSHDSLQVWGAALLNQIGGGSYVPAVADIQGFPIFETGDFITYETPEGQYVGTYILSRKLKGINSLTDTIKGEGCENYGNALTNNHEELIQLRGQANRLKRTVEGVTSEVETIRDDYASKSELQQTSDSITAQIEYLQQEIDGDVKIYYINETPTLLNYPANTFTYNIPVNNTVQLRDDLPFEYTVEYYQKNLRTLVYDETNNVAYRFIKQDGVFGWVEVADTEMGAVLQRLASLEITTEAITAEVQEIQTDYATKTELNSKVEQTAQSITSTVSANYQTKTAAETTRQSLQSQITQNAGNINLKVSKGAVVSEINQSPDVITLNSNRLVVNSTNFKLDQNGRVQIAGDLRSGTDNNWFTRLNSAGISMYKDNSEVGYVASNVAGGMNFSAKNNIDFIINGAVMLRVSAAPGSNVKHKFFGDVEFSEFIYPNYCSVSKNLGVAGDAIISSNLYVLGRKDRVVETETFGKVCQNAYETCEPFFGDIGESVTDENGFCVVSIDEIFAETVTLEEGYHVFLQEYGEGKLWVEERNPGSFIVKGTPGLKFSWEIKAKQKGYEHDRLKQFKEEK